MSERNATIFRRQIIEAIDLGNVDVYDEVLGHGFKWHGNGEDVDGVEEMKRRIVDVRSAIPDLRVTINDIIADGDRAVARFSATGTDIASGKRVTSCGIAIAHFADGKIVEEWMNSVKW